jgi:hypothetical protein
MLIGLTLPFLTEADPEQAGEGSLDPLGLVPVADRLADTIAPGVTARMTRIRFVTAIAIGAVVTESLSDVMAADGVSPAYLAYEWLVVEALARDKYLPPSATMRVPGIEKARSVVVRKAHMDSRSYLKVPKVFGFHGIYKRLARDVEVVDDHLLLGSAGDRLVRLWEEEQELSGFSDRVAGTPGGLLARNIESAVRDGLTHAGVRLSLSSHLWSKVVAALRPDGALPKERDLLFELLTDPVSPVRRELILGIHALRRDGSEPEILRALRKGASPALAARLDAIDAYERVAELLMACLNTLRRVSTARGTSPVSPKELESNPILLQAVDELAPALTDAYERLERLGDLVAQAVLVLGEFEGVVRPTDLTEALLLRHEEVQDAKGKRPWFERTARGFVVRPLFRTGDDPTIERRYVHPYRVTALRSFLSDLTA